MGKLNLRSFFFSQIFFSIDEKPLACASIAQVHHGYLRDPKTNLKGKECAIKIQRPLIRTYARNDLWCFRLMLKLHEFAFGLPLSYFGQYITDQIQDETLFEKELENAKRARLEVMNDRSKEIRETCYVPQCFEEWSTSRVLVMEFIGKPLVKMTDKDGIEEMGLNVKRVCRSVMELSAAQIFDHGHLQADGHPGNVSVDVVKRWGERGLLFYHSLLLFFLSLVSFLLFFHLSDLLVLY